MKDARWNNPCNVRLLRADSDSYLNAVRMSVSDSVVREAVDRIWSQFEWDFNYDPALISIPKSLIGQAMSEIYRREDNGMRENTLVHDELRHIVEDELYRRGIGLFYYK